MRIPNETISIVLESEDGNAEFTFQKAKYNEVIKYTSPLLDSERNADGSLKDLPAFNKAWREYRAFMFGTCTSVSGIVNPDESPVTVEQVRAQEFQPDMANKIWDALQAVTSGGGASEKNEPSPEGQSSD